jgi:hypothetical protein
MSGAVKAIIWAMFFCLSLTTTRTSQASDADFVGNWNLVSYVFEDLATGETTALLGEHPIGHIIFTPEGRMMVLIVHEKRGPPKTDEDRIDLHKYMLAYSGRYEVADNKIVTHVDVSWDERNTGKDVVRFFKLEGDTLTIKTPPLKNAFNGKQTVNILSWKREH